MLGLSGTPIGSIAMEDGCSNTDQNSDPCVRSSLRGVAAVKQEVSAKASEAFGAIEVVAAAAAVVLDEFALTHSTQVGQYYWECFDGDHWQKLDDRVGWVVKLQARQRPDWERWVVSVQHLQCFVFASRWRPACRLKRLEFVSMRVEVHRVAERETVQIRRDVVHGLGIAPTALEKWAARIPLEGMRMPR